MKYTATINTANTFSVRKTWLCFHRNILQNSTPCTEEAWGSSGLWSTPTFLLTIWHHCWAAWGAKAHSDCPKGLACTSQCSEPCQWPLVVSLAFKYKNAEHSDFWLCLWKANRLLVSCLTSKLLGLQHLVLYRRITFLAWIIFPTAFILGIKSVVHPTKSTSEHAR